MKKIGILMTLCCLALMSQGQIRKFELGVNGLTCSQCSRNVEMSLRKLSFVKDVEMNLEHTEGAIFLKDGADIDIKRISRAVEDAGFSVRYLKGMYSVHDLKLAPDNCTDLWGNKYVFVKSNVEVLNGEVTLWFLGDKYMDKKEAREWKPLLKNNCNTTQLYYVTLVK